MHGHGGPTRLISGSDPTADDHRVVRARGPRGNRRVLCVLGSASARAIAVMAGPGVLSLIVFAYALTRVEADAAGRGFAAYGGIYIVASLVWLKVVEGVAPDRWEILGGGG